MEAERLRLQSARRLADGGAQLPAGQRVLRRRRLSHRRRARPAHGLTAPVIYGLLVWCWILR